MFIETTLTPKIAAPSFAKTKAQKQADVRKSAQQTLAKLYQARPSAKAAIKAAAGYAAFSNFGMKILLAGGGKFRFAPPQALCFHPLRGLAVTLLFSPLNSPCQH